MDKPELDQAVQAFERENPELVEAMHVFGIAAAEYERVLAALYPTVTYSAGSSSQPAPR